MNHCFTPLMNNDNTNDKPNDWPTNLVDYNLAGNTSSVPSLAGYYSLADDQQKEQNPLPPPPPPPPRQRITINRPFVTQYELQAYLESIHAVQKELNYTREKIKLLEIRSMLQIQLIMNQRKLDNLKHTQEKQQQIL